MERGGAGRGGGGAMGPPAGGLRILRARGVTAEGFARFGRLVGPLPDGAGYEAGLAAGREARLVLDRGQPRFYIMRLPAKGLGFDRITHHKACTQCLGGLGPEPWYMAVAEASEVGPSETDLHAFRIPPGVFVQLDEGTWHAGPLFGGNAERDFYNLELTDTNQVDHHNHVYGREGLTFKVVDEDGNDQ